MPSTVILLSGTIAACIYIFVFWTKCFRQNEKKNHMADQKPKKIDDIKQEKEKEDKSLQIDLIAESRADFLKQYSDLGLWTNSVKTKLQNTEMPKELETIGNMIQGHKDLKEDIKGQKPKFENIRMHGKRILVNISDASNVANKLQTLDKDEEEINRMWDIRYKELKYGFELQFFTDKANLIDDMSICYGECLDSAKHAETLQDVETLLKENEEFAKTLIEQDEKLEDLDKMADDLIAKEHPDKDHIDNRRNEVLGKRREIKKRASDRHNELLLVVREIQDFKREADELLDGMKDIYKTAVDKTCIDLAKLDENMKKHQALEADIEANYERFQALSDRGHSINMNPSPEIKQILHDLNTQWEKTNEKVKEKWNMLQQAADLNKAMTELKVELDDMEQYVTNPDCGSDDSGVEKLLKDLDDRFRFLTDQISNINSLRDAVLQSGLFYESSFIKTVENFNSRYENLKKAMLQRKEKLNDSMNFFKFSIEVVKEVMWIKDRLPDATSQIYGENAEDTRALKKKHDKLNLEITNHRSVKNVLEEGKKLIEQNNYSEKIKDMCQELEISWKDLVKQSNCLQEMLALVYDVHILMEGIKKEIDSKEVDSKNKNPLKDSSDKGRINEEKLARLVNNEADRLLKNRCPDPETVRKMKEDLKDHLEKLKNFRKDAKPSKA